MALNERSMNSRINSEIHASLRRLEDANYVSSEIQANNLNTVIDQANAANQGLQSQINSVIRDLGTVEGYIHDHIKDGDLCLFQNIFTGNLQVSDGGVIGGEMEFTGAVTFSDSVMVSEDLDLVGSIIIGEDYFAPHTLTIEGTEVGTILAADDLSFNLAGHVNGSWSGGTYTVKTKKNKIEIASTTITVTPYISYDRTTHKYVASADVRSEDNVVRLVSDAKWSGTEAYAAGKEEGRNFTLKAYISYNSSTHTYTASAAAMDSKGVVIAVTSGSQNKESGTEAYEDGQPDNSTTLSRGSTGPGGIGWYYYSRYDHGQSWEVYWD